MSELELIDIFGDNLRDVLEESGYSQSELAEGTGLTKSTISKYINKQIMPSLKSVMNICLFLDCNIDDLLPMYMDYIK